ncbi:hypothetical protein QTP88_028593 [Uroleucon formosanum]
MAKILKKIVNTRLIGFLKKAKILSDLQSGFRKHRSTIDSLTIIKSEVNDAFNSNQYLGLISIDIAKAYDSVWRHRVLQILSNILTNGNMFNYIKCFLNSRQFSISFPPWAFNIDINLDLTKFKKELTSPMIYKNHLNEILQDHKNANCYYTDASKSRKDMGIAITNHDLSIRFKLPKSCSIYTAEAIAILKTVDHILLNHDHGNPHKSNLILTDSLSSLTSLKNPLSTIDIAKLIFQKTSLSYQTGIKISLIWIPRHSDIEQRFLTIGSRSRETSLSSFFIKPVVVKNNENEKTESNGNEQEIEKDEMPREKVKIPMNYTYKYIDKYIGYGFTYINENGVDLPQCVICGIVLANASLKPNKLLRHLETNHNEYRNKTTDFFLRKRDELKINKKNIKSYTTVDKVYLKCSFIAAMHIAKTKKPYNIGEKLIKPCMVDICSELFADEIFKTMNSYMISKNINWASCIGICTDGAVSMTGIHSGVVSRVKEVAHAHLISTRCFIHREQLAVKDMGKNFNDILNQCTTIINFIRARAINSRIFSVMCKEFGSVYNNVLFHSHIRWISRGKILTRFIELRTEIEVFLREKNSPLSDLFQDIIWLAKVTYLSDIFSLLNELNLSMQGPLTNIFTCYNKVEAFLKKLDLWIKRIQENTYDIHLLELSSDKLLEQSFNTKNLNQFWISLSNEYPNLYEEALKKLVPFATTYLCESGFSTLTTIKTKSRNKLDVEPTMCISLTNSIEAQIDSLVKQHQDQGINGIKVFNMQSKFETPLTLLNVVQRHTRVVGLCCNKDVEYRQVK